MFDLDELARATEIVRRYVPPTPQFEWPLLSQVAGSAVVVKHENHTPVGAFKVRGGLVYMDRLARERPDVSGVVSATRGNHGQSLAFAGRVHDRSVTIFVPHGNSVEKNASMRALGAEVVEFGDDFQEARERSIEFAAERGLEPVPPFHPDLVLGVATYAKELFDGAGELDTIYVPVGMGSGINALIAVRDLLGLDTQIVGVVSELAPSTLLSFERGGVVTTESAATFVDGVATRSPDPVSIAGIVAGTGAHRCSVRRCDRRGDADHLPNDPQRRRVGRSDRACRPVVGDTATAGEAQRVRAVRRQRGLVAAPRRPRRRHSDRLTSARRAAPFRRAHTPADAGSAMQWVRLFRRWHSLARVRPRRPMRGSNQESSTLRSARPRKPGTNLKCGGSAGSASRICGNRATSESIAIWASIRASGAPRQRCGPPPNDT